MRVNVSRTAGKEALATIDYVTQIEHDPHTPCGARVRGELVAQHWGSFQPQGVKLHML